MRIRRIAINGFGRIGRRLLRIISEMPDMEVVAINDLSDATTMAHLLKYDSIHGRLAGEIRSEGNSILINGHAIKFFSESDPLNLPWKSLQVDVVVESTGKFTDKINAAKHLTAGAKKVIISAPSPSSEIKMVVLGVNDYILNDRDQIVSNASCTTNCAAPMIKILDETWGVKEAFITTVHSYTGDQHLHDTPHSDLRRARAACTSIIPTSTGAAKALTRIFPQLAQRIGGCGIRVPVSNGSLTDITCLLSYTAPVSELNAVFKMAAQNSMKGIVEYTEDPIVSVDIIGNTHSCVFDAGYTSVVGNMVKIIGWYDNETGYSCRLADLIKRI